MSMSRELFARLFNVEIRPNGSCRCPFHDDKTPSMKVWDNGSYSCRSASCPASGGSILNAMAYYVHGDPALLSGDLSSRLSAKQIAELYERIEGETGAGSIDIKPVKSEVYVNDFAKSEYSTIYQQAKERYAASKDFQQHIVEEHGIYPDTGIAMGLGILKPGEVMREDCYRVVIPYFDHHMDLCGMNSRVLSRKTDRRLKYHTWPGSRRTAYHKRDLWPYISKTLPYVVLAESEWEVLHLVQADIALAMSVPAISTGKVDDLILPALRRTKKLIIIANNDSDKDTNVGINAAVSRAGYIGNENTVVVIPPDGHKDLADFAMNTRENFALMTKNVRHFLREAYKGRYNILE